MRNLRKRTNENVSSEASDWESMMRCFVENRQNYLPERRTKAMIAGHYKQRRAAGTEVASLTFRLICPLTKRRIVVPARSVNCTHVQCFDLASYLRMQMNAEHPAWTCPICKVPADTGRLKIDEFASKVLASDQTQSAEGVTLFQDGTFEAVVAVHAADVVTQEDLELVVDENPIDLEDIKPFIDRACSLSNDSFSNRASADKSDLGANEASVPAKRARFEAAEATVERQRVQPGGDVDHPESLQGDTQTRTPSSLSGQHEQLHAVVEAHPPSAARCLEQFTSKQIFVEHRAKYHLSEQIPAPCTQCTSRSENGAVYHCEVHHEVKRFSCTECPRSFLKEDLLERHGVDHNSSHRTRCPSCGGIFRHVQGLTTHRKDGHHEKIDWCFVCKDVYTEYEQEHVSSEAHQEALKLKAICDQLKISCANCSKQWTGTHFLLVDGTQANVRQWSIAKNCEECRRTLVRAGKPSGESARTDLSEVRRMLAEQESTAEETKRKQQQRAPLLLEAEKKAREAIKKVREAKKKAREAKRTPDQAAQTQVSSTGMSSHSACGRGAHPAPAQLAHYTQTHHGSWPNTLPAANAIGYPYYQGSSHPIQLRADFVPTASGPWPHPEQCPPFPPLRPPPTAEKHVMDEYYRQLGMFYDQQMHRYPY